MTNKVAQFIRFPNKTVSKVQDMEISDAFMADVINNADDCTRFYLPNGNYVIVYWGGSLGYARI